MPARQKQARCVSTIVPLDKIRTTDLQLSDYPSLSDFVHAASHKHLLVSSNAPYSRGQYVSPPDSLRPAFCGCRKQGSFPLDTLSLWDKQAFAQRICVWSPCGGDPLAARGNETTICLLQNTADDFDPNLFLLHVDFGNHLIVASAKFHREKTKSGFQNLVGSFQLTRPSRNILLSFCLRQVPQPRLLPVREVQPSRDTTSATSGGKRQAVSRLLRKRIAVSKA